MGKRRVLEDAHVAQRVPKTRRARMKKWNVERGEVKGPQVPKKTDQKILDKKARRHGSERNALRSTFFKEKTEPYGTGRLKGVQSLRERAA